MSEARRKRLASVIEPLLELEDFSSAEAKRRCSETSPSYVTLTLGQLVNQGLLTMTRSGSEHRYRWARPTGEFEPSRWIDSQIHGLQVKQQPVQDRPRERLLRDGASALSDADLLAILIRVGVRNESAVEGARRIANRFAGRWEDLPKCGPAELKAITPAGTAVSYAQIMAGVELGRRVARSIGDKPPTAMKITGTAQAIEYCRQVFSRLADDAVQEEFHIVTLDTKHKPIMTHRVTVGTLDASLVHPREVFRPAIRDAASAILLVHNHPSGDPTPSREDHQVTRQLTDAGNLLGINVLDHIVVARTACVSLREQG